MRVYLLVVILTSLFIAGCGERKPSSVPQGRQTDQSLSQGESLAAPIFPHTADWANPDLHGAWVSQNGFTVCLNCHQTESTRVETIPTCSFCHSLFPHPALWRNFEGHGNFVLGTLRGNTSLCATCHTVTSMPGAPAFCNTCHANFPHPENWREGNRHGPFAYGVGKVTCASANCHGTNFTGSPQAPSCLACHGDYPHTNPQWMSLNPTNQAADRDENFHGDLFIRRSANGEANPCSECHGMNYDLSPGGARCLTCHSRGITHHTVEGVAWNSGLGHGRFFSGQFNSNTSDTNCEHCHGAPVGFDGTQTMAFLSGASDCYQCHFAYPHVSYRISPATWNWAPMIDNCGAMTGNMAHIIYMLRPDGSPLFTNAAGTPPSVDPNSATNIPAIQNTCGRSEGGSCHFNGNRSFRTPPNVALCTGYCHNPSNPDIPFPPDRSCPPSEPEPGTPCPAPQELCYPEEGDPFCYDPMDDPDSCSP